MPSPGSTINISGLTPIDDPEYRYKMPVVFGKIEGRGNGIKTVIPNITDVAFSLHRQPGEVNKFFGCELGAQTTYAVEAERAVVNGAHTDAVLQQMIHRYVEEFVLCPSCGLPETEYKIKNDTIWHRCAACGANEMVNMEHKLCTYILAQDKKRRQDEKKLEKGKKAEKKDRKTNDKATSKEKNGEGNEGSEKAKSKEHKKPKKKADSDSGGDEEKKKKKKEKRDKEKKKKHGSNGHHHHGDKNHLGDVDDLSVEEAGVDDSGAMGK